MDAGSLLIAIVLIGIVAALYSSVGHGGASGYLAVLSFFLIPAAQLSSAALVLNILVAGIAFAAYASAGHAGIRLALPFMAASIPAAYIGGAIHLTERMYFLLLGFVLVATAYRLARQSATGAMTAVRGNPPILVALIIGAVLGVVSGLVGVGGGIFLSPLILLFRWSEPKETAGASALFIVVNSLAGVAGRFTSGTLILGPIWPLIGAAAFGGLIGSYAGSRWFSNPILRRLLAVMLFIAACKLFFAYGW